MAEEKKEWVEPAEVAATHEKIKAFLTEKGVEFKVTEHEAVKTCEEAATVRGVSLDTGAKAMLLKDSGKKLTREGVEYYLAIMSASKRFNSKQFKKVTGCKNSRFASPEECFTVTGQLNGAVSPFGSLFKIPVWVDRSLSKEENINFNAGLRTHSIAMTYADYFKAEAPTWHVFTDEEIALGDLPVEEKKEEAKGNDREAAKAARLAARQAKEAKKSETNLKDDPSSSLFGDRELNRGQCDPELRFTKIFTDVKNIDESIVDQNIIVRGRLQESKATGKLNFIIMRQQFSTIQMTMAVSEKISKGMVNFSAKVPRESIVEVLATVVKPEKPIEKCS